MDIQIQNEYWQIFYNQNLTYYIYGAYLDSRPIVTENNVFVRILAMINLISQNSSQYPKSYCQFWFRERFQPVIEPVKHIQLIWKYKWGHDPLYSFPHILTCQVPRIYKNWIPKSVSLVAEPCERATNLVRVVYRPLKFKEKKKDFAVCIKGLDFPYTDISHRLVEYLETLRILGAQKVIVYNLEVHENTTKVLDYYKSTGYLEKHEFSFSLRYSNLPEYRHLQLNLRKDAFRLHESLLYNDCIYRNMYRYKYIGVWDIDELPMPLNLHKNWLDLAKVSKNSEDSLCKNYASLCFRCAYFPSYAGNFSSFNQFPSFLYMLQHVRRVRNLAAYGFAAKCLHDTNRIVVAHNHFPIHFKADCRDYTFKDSDAQLNHYREPDFKENLTNPVIDVGLWRFGQRISKEALKILEELKFVT